MTGLVLSAAAIGFDGHLIRVECDSSNGLPTLQIVGLGNKAIEEAKERVRSAIKNSMLEFPAQRNIINLAPANLPKDGTHFDLPIALAILIVGDQLKQRMLEDTLVVGELALDGTIRPVRGVIAFAEIARSSGIGTIIVPKENAPQAALIDGVQVIGVSSLKELFLILRHEKQPEIAKKHSHHTKLTARNTVDISHIYGQEQAKRALIIAAAGHHNILFNGPPGAGKTMLARALVGLMPPLEQQEIIEVTKLYSLAGEANDTVIAERPFRSPHHTASYISLVGGGNKPTPGEISLAHHGVLFLDELPEYPRSSLESLRQPLEDRTIHISRANGRVSYPANFMLVATQNPCPCGFAGDQTKECQCSALQIAAYRKKLSGPLLDRIDLVIPVARVETEELLRPLETSTKESEDLQKQIINARKRQYERYGNTQKTNATLTSQEVKKYVPLDKPTTLLLNSAADRLSLSARSYFKVIKVAQTIADLAAAERVQLEHVTEALQYRAR